MNVTHASIVAALVMAAGFLFAFAKPIEPPNPPAAGDIAAPPEVASALRRACYDCHSDETRWPWYSRVPLISRLVANEVESGRRQVNFSQWSSYYPATRRRKLQWIGRAVEQQDMPPLRYRVLHPGTYLSQAERAAIEHWVDSQIFKNQAPISPDQVPR
jgi:mono/diheme cytochrome c family protein